MPLRLGVDAFNLAADRRGMGRIVRQNLRSLARSGEAEIVLVARDERGRRALAEEFAFTPVLARDLRRAHPGAVWYPWNGMRFEAFAPAIVTINDPFAFTYPHRDFVARWREQSPVRRAIRRADRIIAISHWGASELQRLFGVSPDRITVSPPAIDPYWHPVASAEREPYVLFVAGPDARKNAAMLFDAFERAFGAAGSPLLVVAGTLGAADEARLTALRAPHQRVRPSDDELRALYSGALAVAVPSLAEGYGMPAVEAMACGAPVLASDATALPEACDGAAMLLPPEDPDAWSRALQDVAADPALQNTLRERSLKRAARNDPDAPARALLACARQLLEAAR